uniref:Uncharacterized protein n=1 Tax=Oryza glumipatula TaxID=40148 RepID=A0A0D9ZBE5_9ORYZ
MASPRQGEGGSGGGGPVGGGGLGIKAEDLLDGGYSPRGGGSLGTSARFSTMRRRIPSGVEGLGVRVEEDFLSGSGGPRGSGGIETWEAEKDTVEGGGPMAYGWKRPRNPTKRKRILSARI